MILVLVSIREVNADRNSLHHLDVVARVAFPGKLSFSISRRARSALPCHRSRARKRLRESLPFCPGRISRSCVSLKFAVIHMSSSETEVIKFCPTLTFCITSRLFLVMMPLTGAAIRA